MKLEFNYPVYLYHEILHLSNEKYFYENHKRCQALKCALIFSTNRASFLSDFISCLTRTT